jgi:hypothetical protein
MVQLRTVTNNITKEFFNSLLIVYLILLLAENVSNGIVSNYLNVNYLLYAIILFGFFMALTDKRLDMRTIHKRAARAVIVLSIRMHKRQLAYRQQMQAKIAQQREASARQKQEAAQHRARMTSQKVADQQRDTYRKIQDAQFVRPSHRFVQPEAKRDYGRPFRPARHQQRSVDGIK